jgi:hypothetical protein
MSVRPHPVAPSMTAPAPVTFKNSLRVNIYPDTFFVVVPSRRRLPPRAIIRQAAPARLRDHVRFAPPLVRQAPTTPGGIAHPPYSVVGNR